MRKLLFRNQAWETLWKAVERKILQDKYGNRSNKLYDWLK